MTLSERPRLKLGSWPTPLIRARRLEARLGCGPLLVKRDDLSGFAVAGSKARALEYLLGAAIADGHDALVVGGVATSNFCQAAAVAARIAGLGCHIVLPGHPPPHPAANLAMALACGAQVSFSGGPREQLDERIRERAAELNRSGRSALADSARRCQRDREPGFRRRGGRVGRAVGRSRSRSGPDRVGCGLRRQHRRTAGRFEPAGCPLDADRGVGQPPGGNDDRAPALSGPRLRRPAWRDPTRPGRGEAGAGTRGPRTAQVAPPPRTSGRLPSWPWRPKGWCWTPTTRRGPFRPHCESSAADGLPVVFWHTGGLVAAISDYATAAIDLDAAAAAGTQMLGGGS